VVVNVDFTVANVMHPQNFGGIIAEVTALSSVKHNVERLFEFHGF
jgi:hypothetical protein